MSEVSYALLVSLSLLDADLFLIDDRDGVRRRSRNGRQFIDWTRLSTDAERASRSKPAI